MRRQVYVVTVCELDPWVSSKEQYEEDIEIRLMTAIGDPERVHIRVRLADQEDRPDSEMPKAD